MDRSFLLSGVLPMWKTVLVGYGAGLLFTAVALLSPQRTRHDRVMNAGSILLWPLYWTYFLALVLLNRKRS
jgi:hypothetical protein